MNYDKKSVFELRHYEFTPDLPSQLNNNHYASNSWPIVYIISNEKKKEAYIGETTDTLKRVEAHLRNGEKAKLTSIHLITSPKFNKSATLDIESNLIKYLSGDGKFKLLNATIGLANHNYYQKKEVYWDIFNSIWNSLRSQGVAKHSIQQINNSDLFKYSPYKSLTKEQQSVLVSIMTGLLGENQKNIIVEGGAGTGKTILAIFLFKLLKSDLHDFNFKEFGEDEAFIIELIDKLRVRFKNLKMGLVVPMSSFRETLKKVFKNIKGLNAKMVIGPSDISKEKFDILLIDESHRLRRRVNLGAYVGAFDKACERLNLDKNNTNELEWATLQSQKLILFYDENQSIKPTDVLKKDFDLLKKQNNTTKTQIKSQFRVKGGNAFVQHIRRMLNDQETNFVEKFTSKKYDFLLFDSLEEMVETIKLRDQEQGLSRLIAGYSWKWISQEDKSLYDIDIEGYKLQWNHVTKDWINSSGAIDQVGCIHTTQGYDLNYSGVIFGNEIGYDKQKDEIIIRKENYFDRYGKQKVDDPKELKDFILNIYSTILQRAIKGTYVYVCDNDLRDYLSQYIPKAYQTYGVKNIEKLSLEEIRPFVDSIPLYSLKVAAGEFGSFQNPNELEWISIPEGYKASKDLFVCQVVGESMNKVIPNKSYCLFKKYQGGSRNGLICLVEHTDIQDEDFGSCYTIKEYHSKKIVTDEGWEHESITLRPISTDSSYQDIVLRKEEGNFRVIGVFQSIL